MFYGIKYGTHKLPFDSTLDVDLTFDDLVLAFEELQEQYNQLMLNILNLKKSMIHYYLNLILH